MTKITLRAATIDDIPAIQKMGRASREAAFVDTGHMTIERNEEDLASAWSVDMLTMSMTIPANHAIVAVDDEKVIGYLSGRFQNPLDEGQVRLYRIYLHPDYWGQGVGYKMWQSYINALSDDVKRIDVGSASWNEQATAFYQRLGFKVISTHEEKHQLQISCENLNVS
ncbi:MAG: GNAT family N-acetyltransferase [Chloroflexota bacterium]